MSHADRRAHRAFAVSGWQLGRAARTILASTRLEIGVERRRYMGLAMSVPQLLIILVIVALIFGTKRLKEVGGDLGSAVKSFRKAMSSANEAAEEIAEPPKQLTRDEQEKK
jgi:sec-independent protein translocase protein TatA